MYESFQCNSHCDLPTRWLPEESQKVRNPSPQLFYTDFAKAFDKVLHHVLLQQLANLGIGGCFLKILEKYLKDRKHFVRIRKIQSSTMNLTNGIHHRTSSVWHF